MTALRSTGIRWLEAPKSSRSLSYHPCCKDGSRYFYCRLLEKLASYSQSR